MSEEKKYDDRKQTTGPFNFVRLSELAGSRPKRVYLDGTPVAVTDEATEITGVRYNPKYNTMELLRGDKCFYDIDMTRMSTPQDLLGWCFHLEAKDWCTPAVAGAMILLIRHLVYEASEKTAEHCYCHRSSDSQGKEKDGFDWSRKY